MRADKVREGSYSFIYEVNAYLSGYLSKYPTFIAFKVLQS